MNEAEFLNSKRKYEARFGVPTTPYKKELNELYLLSIEYV